MGRQTNGCNVYYGLLREGRITFFMQMFIFIEAVISATAFAPKNVRELKSYYTRCHREAARCSVC